MGFEMLWISKFHLQFLNRFCNKSTTASVLALSSNTISLALPCSSVSAAMIENHRTSTADGLLRTVLFELAPFKYDFSFDILSEINSKDARCYGVVE